MTDFTPKKPRTRAEWQEAVDLAAGLRALADCKMYGLIEGGPEINVAKCDYVLEQGKRRGFSPSRPVTELAVAVVEAINREEGA